MTIDAAFFGRLGADADSRISKGGKPWVRLRVAVGRDDETQWLTLSVFGEAAKAAAELRKGDRIYAEGSLKLDRWKGNDGVERSGLAVAAFRCMRTHQIGRNRPRRDHDRGSDDSSAEESPPLADSTIPF
jgi:single-strand DNA-binding protein